MATVLRIGSRRTPLALAQTQRVVKDLTTAHPDVQVEIVEIVSDGDVQPDVVLGPGVFVAALRNAILDGRVDAAVHSLKDLPTAPLDGVVLAAVTEREDPRDVLVARDGLALDELPRGSRIGTSSPRRATTLIALDRGFEPVPVRGSVGRRLQRIDDGEVDALVLARAGLLRLGLADRITDTIDPGRMIPAAGQGALAVECRSDDAATHDLLRSLDDLHARAATDAERTLLAVLEAGCTHPVGAYAEVAEGDDGETELYLRAIVHASDGSDQVRLSTTGPLNDAQEVGRRLALDLLAAGADALMERQ
jgi:hydroxymethylbilane synthase